MAAAGHRNGARRWWRPLAALFGALALGSGSVSAQEAPAHWMAYAAAVGGQLQQRLQQEQDSQAQRVLAWLQAHPDMPAPLPVSLWITADGRISKLAFDSLGDAQVDADLRATLQASPLPAPPADMRQPLRLGLVLTR
ncbi:TonB C-terminal domain-containing protein [Stenotrophomonas maltophilia]|uniref:TonB C-terminal domain-containing protein n=1 Tax=Stenotrophomonas maltophilia TaxID=40324 RepID=UPI00201CE910|nr:TonB C-terminal domain-containing protein [Stenotrophomonas maltophilia]UQY94393.1 TonB C-terminal domain-containing protein [Stenotrophomonas maltophilia]